MNNKLIVILAIIAMTIIRLSSSIKAGATEAPHKARTTMPTNTSVFSPLTLNSEWSPTGLLLLSLTSSVLGSILCGFFVASFCCDDVLSRIGNVYLACVGLTDLIITSGVLPVPAVLIVTGQWDTKFVCYITQFITEASTYCYSMFFMFVSIETYIRQCTSLTCYFKFISCPIDCVSVFIFIIGFFVSGTGVYFGLDYDYCARIHIGNPYYRFAMTIIFHFIPFLITVTCFTATIMTVKIRASQQPHYRRSLQFEHDLSTTKLNIAIYLFFVIMWIPYIVVSIIFPHTTDTIYYICAWIGVSRSVFSSFIFNTMHSDLRNAFGNLCNYCCCKYDIPSPLRNRRRRSVNGSRSTGDVWLNVMPEAARSERRRSSSIDTYTF